jgi:methyl-accepting chemotaxis protein
MSDTSSQNSNNSFILNKLEVLFFSIFNKIASNSIDYLMEYFNITEKDITSKDALKNIKNALDNISEEDLKELSSSIVRILVILQPAIMKTIDIGSEAVTKILENALMSSKSLFTLIPFAGDLVALDTAAAHIISATDEGAEAFKETMEIVKNTAAQINNLKDRVNTNVNDFNNTAKKVATNVNNTATNVNNTATNINKIVNNVPSTNIKNNKLIGGGIPQIQKKRTIKNKKHSNNKTKINKLKKLYKYIK